MKQRQILLHGEGITRGEYYESCANCAKHPNYSQPPMTMHRDGVCLLCFNLSAKK